ncbi:MAG: hypothetical protein BJ554DRAFT_354 [Olpidium bornovanus]|uniref:Uncharacterized protein n=1 Tax=Olpidium bornovanus TaxID=278681 RepID=A0A8H8DIN0_9FUNG|nr:MAG: hypothetical protein BJ554DRAFT_354 [Olpidium bornovanus]
MCRSCRGAADGFCKPQKKKKPKWIFFVAWEKAGEKGWGRRFEGDHPQTWSAKFEDRERGRDRDPRGRNEFWEGRRHWRAPQLSPPPAARPKTRPTRKCVARATEPRPTQRTPRARPKYVVNAKGKFCFFFFKTPPPQKKTLFRPRAARASSNLAARDSGTGGGGPSDGAVRKPVVRPTTPRKEGKSGV